MHKKEIQEQPIFLYQTDDGKVRVEVRFEHENVWLSQKLMAELFDTTKQNISLHLAHIFKEGELSENSVVKDFLTTAADQKTYRTKFYSLIYSTSIDYQKNSAETVLFFKTVQIKMHFAVSGKTAAEIIAERADSQKPEMGLTNFSGIHPIQRDIYIAKNYLAAKELEALNRIVDAYLSFAEIQAQGERAMTMKNWIEKLDEYLALLGKGVLKSAGRVSAEKAERKATKEYEMYRHRQAKHYISDFDRVAKKLAST